MKMVMKIDRPRREEVVFDDQRVGQLEQVRQAERGQRGTTQEQRVEEQQRTLRLQSKTRRGRALLCNGRPSRYMIHTL